MCEAKEPKNELEKMTRTWCCVWMWIWMWIRMRERLLWPNYCISIFSNSKKYSEASDNSRTNVTLILVRARTWSFDLTWAKRSLTIVRIFNTAMIISLLLFSHAVFSLHVWQKEIRLAFILHICIFRPPNKLNPICLLSVCFLFYFLFFIFLHWCTAK